MDDLTIQGIQAIKEGDKARARSLFLSALDKDADNSQAWLWLSGAVDSDEDRLECLQQVLRVDPGNQAAAKGITLLVEKGVVPPELPPSPVENPPMHFEEGIKDAWQLETPEEPAEKTEPAQPEMVPESPSTAEQEMAPEASGVTGPVMMPEGSSITGPEIVPEISVMAETEKPSETSSMPEPEMAPETSSSADQVNEVAETIEPGVPVPSAEGEVPVEDNYKVPESFFEPEPEAEPLPIWMTSSSEEESKPPIPVPLESISDVAGVQIPEPGAVEETGISEANLTPQEAIAPQVSPMSEAPAPMKVEEVTLFKIRPSLVTLVLVYGLGAIVLFLATMALLLIVYNTDTLPVLVGLFLATLLLLAILGLLAVGVIRHLMTNYTITNWRVYMESGVFSRKHRSIPLPKISSITLKQGPLQKILAIGNLTLHLEGPDGVEEVTQLVDVSKAERVIDRIGEAQRKIITPQQATTQAQAV